MSLPPVSNEALKAGNVDAAVLEINRVFDDMEPVKSIEQQPGSAG